MREIYLEPAMVPAALRGSYSGKKFKALVCETVTVPGHAGLWSGGSRDTYTALEFETGRQVAVSDNVSAPWDDRRDNEVTLRPGFCVVRSTMFQGKDLGLTFYVHPANAAALLPAPAADLTDLEKIVLDATASLKSSYGGRDRYQMACVDHLSYGALPKMTRAQWDETKVALIAKGLLNKAGAITTAGRNARK